MIRRAMRQRYGSTTTLANPDEWLVEAWGGTTAGSGAAVSASTALQCTAVLAAVERLSRTVSSLPHIVYHRLEGGGRERALDHPLYPLLHDQPNDEMTALEYSQFQMAALLLRGNSYAYIDRDGGGQVRELWPLRPDQVGVERRGGRKVYIWTPQSAAQRSFQQHEIHHVHGLSTDGITGLSPIRLAAEAIGLGLAAEGFGARFFSNDARPGGVLSHPKELGDKARKRLEETWKNTRKGFERAHKTAVLEEGMQWQKIGVDPDEAQFLETRKFQVREVARFYNMQPHLIGDLEDATFSNIEAQGIEFVVYTLGFWLRALEQAARRDLFLASERSVYYSEILVDALLRGDAASRAAFYQSLFNMGAISPNEIRERENLNPYPGGDQRFVQLALVPVSQAGAAADARGRLELAGRRAATQPSRRKLRAGFAKLFTETTRRLFRNERNRVMDAARKALGQRQIGELLTWMEGFYQGEHREQVERQIAPIVAAYSDAVLPGVMDELGIAIAADDPRMRELQVYLSEMTAAHAARHARSSLGQLSRVAGESSGRELEALELEFEHWDQVRAPRIGRRAGVQIGEGVAKFVIAAAGFRLVWDTFGSACDICAPFHGVTIGSSGLFAQAGDTLEAGENEPIRLSHNVSTPPLHDGCDCGVGPA